MNAKQLAQELNKLQQAYRASPGFGRVGVDGPLDEFAKELTQLNEEVGTTLKWMLTWAQDDTRTPV